MTAAEKAVLAALGPMMGPVLQNLWSSDLLPYLQSKLTSGSPEIQVVETAFVSFMGSIVAGELPNLSKL